MAASIVRSVASRALLPRAAVFRSSDYGVHTINQQKEAPTVEKLEKILPCTMIPGDGVGPELMHSVKEVFKAGGVPVKFDELFFSELNPYLSVSVEKVVESVLANGVCLMHYLKTPDTSPTGELGSLNMKFRRGVDLFANVVHIKSLPGVRSRHKDLDFIIIREQTEGEYSAMEHESVKGVVESMKIVTREKSRRIAKFAFDYAIKHGRKKVTAVHKANIMKLGDGLFLQCCEEISRLYPTISFSNLIIDNCTMQMVSNPHQFDVLVMPNLYGTIIDNLAAGIIGGAGVCVGSSYSTTSVVYEPGARHTFSEAVGKNVANPTAMLLCSAKMLDHLNLRSYAAMVRNAVTKVLLDAKVRTKDMGGYATSTEFTQAVIMNLNHRMEKFAREIDLESVGKVLRIEQNLVGDVGCVVWDAALALVKFLDVQKLNPAASETIVDVSGKTIVELGSGTGCVGIAAALLGAKTVGITDLKEFISLCEENVALNGVEDSCFCIELDWQWPNVPESLCNADFILFSDCIYYREALKPLVNTVLKLCGEKTTVMMSFEDRSESFAEHGKLVREFFDSMKDNDFECDAVPCCQQHPEFVAEEIKLFALKRKSK